MTNESNQDRGYHLTDQLYHSVQHKRDSCFQWLAVQLTRLKITANTVTLMGIVMMVLYSCCMFFSQTLAMLFLIAAVLLDGIDGVLARYQQTSSDRGKFMDVMADNFSSFLFSLGLAFAHLVNPLIIITYVYMMLLGKVYKIYLNSFQYQSDWLFRAVAGFFTNFISYLAYLLFIVAIFMPINLNPIFLGMTIALALYCVWHFLRIINLRLKCDPNLIK